MKNLSLRILAVMMALLMIVGLTACGGGGDTSSDSPSTSESSAPEALAPETSEPETSEPESSDPTEDGKTTTTKKDDGKTTTTGKKDDGKTTTGKKDDGKKTTTTAKKDDGKTTATSKKTTTSKTTTTKKTTTTVDASSGTYTLESVWRKGNEKEYNAERVWSSQRYIVDVYLSGMRATSGTVNLGFDNSLFQYMGRVNANGVNTTVTAVGDTVEMKWTGTVDASKKRVKIASVYFFFTKHTMTFNDIKAKDHTKVVYPTGTQVAGGKKASISANSYKGEIAATVFPNELSSVKIGGTSLSSYKIVVKQSDATANKTAKLVQTFIKDKTGISLSIVDASTAAAANEIVVGVTNRKASPISGENKFKVFCEGSKIYLFFGNEKSGQEAAGAFATKIIGKNSAGYNSSTRAVTVSNGASVEGTAGDGVRFAITSDTHVGVTGTLKGQGFASKMYGHIVKEHNTNPLDFVVALGDQLDMGYDDVDAMTAASKQDYDLYLQVVKDLTICDPVNPFGSKMDKSKIPHYEIKGNHDPSIYTRFIGGANSQMTVQGDIDSSLTKRENSWMVTAANGDKVAFVASEALYRTYPSKATNAYGYLSDAALADIENDLKAAKKAGASKIVFLCHFSYAHIDHITDEGGRLVLKELFDEYGVDVFFNGHEHATTALAMAYQSLEGVYNISLPSSQPTKANPPSFGVVEIGSYSMTVQWYHSVQGTYLGTSVLPIN